MNEKKFLIKNFNQCVDVYNKWILNNPEIGNPIDSDVIDQFAQLEASYWKPNSQNQVINTTGVLSGQPKTD